MKLLNTATITRYTRNNKTTIPPNPGGFSSPVDNWCARAYNHDMESYFDAHCHILSPDTPVIGGAISNASRMSEWADIVNVSECLPHVYGAIGVHPWYVSELPNDWDVRLGCMLQKHPHLMVGEVGMDKHHPDIPRQESVFVRHLEIAARFGRGIHVHCVGAWGAMRRILDGRRLHLPPFILFHRYSGAVGDIERFAREYNAYFSYGPKSDAARIVATPSNRILVESDSDTPSGIVDVASRVAGIYGCDIELFYTNAMGMIGK